MRAPLLAAGLACAHCAGCGGVERLPPPPECPAGFELVDGACRVREIYFEGGTFQMGRGYCFPLEAHKDEFATGDCQLNDRPHEVTVAPFYLDATEFITGWTCEPDCLLPEKFYWAYDGGEPIADLEARCARFGKHLVDEAQWEFAASGGGARVYPWGDEPPDCTRAIDDTCEAPPIVAARPPSPEGVYDLAGNLPERVAPAPAAYADGYDALPMKTHTGHCECVDCESCKDYGLRGGGFSEGPRALRSAHRATRINLDVGIAGFRCARAP